mmetsp:Transcript_38862/g.49613  ORF Transcript_38862/g.49613 Transcript_38862/m.49613 type:complete len:934 (+) Transcript_38862:111-2912(+)
MQNQTAKSDGMNLESFDEDRQKGPILTSPRSLEACALCGVDPSELIRRPLKWFKRGNKENVSEDVLLIRQEAHEKERQKLLRQVRTERHNLIQEEVREKELGSPKRMQTVKGANESQLLQRELHQLEKAKQRRQAELEHALAVELQRTLQQENLERKQEANVQKQMERSKYTAQRFRELEQARYHRDQRRWAAELEEERKRQEVVEKQQQADQEREMKERERQRLIQARLKQKEAERKAHLLKHKRQVAQARVQVEQDALKLKQAMQMKEQARLAHEEEMRRIRHEEFQKKQEKIALRQEEVRKSQERQNQLKQEQLQRRVEEQERRKAEIERKNEEKRREAKLKAEERSRAIVLAQQAAEAQIQEKKHSIMTQQLADEERLRRRRMQRQRELDFRRNFQAREDRLRRAGVKELIETKEKERVEAAMEKINSKDHGIIVVQEEQRKKIDLMREENRLKDEATKRNLERRKKADEYRRMRLQQKLEMENHRTEKVKAARKELMEKKKKIIDDTALLKVTMTSEFEKIKARGIENAALKGETFELDFSSLLNSLSRDKSPLLQSLETSMPKNDNERTKPSPLHKRLSMGKGAAHHQPIANQAESPSVLPNPMEGSMSARYGEPHVPAKEFAQQGRPSSAHPSRPSSEPQNPSDKLPQLPSARAPNSLTATAPNLATPKDQVKEVWNEEADVTLQVKELTNSQDGFSNPGSRKSPYDYGRQALEDQVRLSDASDAYSKDSAWEVAEKEAFKEPQREVGLKKSMESPSSSHGKEAQAGFGYSATPSVQDESKQPVEENGKKMPGQEQQKQSGELQYDRPWRIQPSRQPSRAKKKKKKKQKKKPKEAEEIAIQLGALKHLRDQHNELLMTILTEEQESEERREALLKSFASDKKQLQKMQKDFSKQRSKASERILWITNRFEDILRAIEVLEQQQQQL